MFKIHVMGYLALQAQVLLHAINSTFGSQSGSQMHSKHGESNLTPKASELEAQIAESCKIVAASYSLFKHKAAEQVSKYSHYLS